MESWRGPYRSTRPTRQGSAPSRLRDRVASGARGLVVTLGPFAITVAPTLGAAAVERCADRGPAVPATRMRAGRRTRAGASEKATRRSGPGRPRAPTSWHCPAGAESRGWT